MTEQITIKLNKQQFRKILDFLHESFYSTAKSDSDITAKLLFDAFLTRSEKNSQGRTREEVLQEMWHSGKPADKIIAEFHDKYNRFRSGELDVFDD